MNDKNKQLKYSSILNKYAFMLLFLWLLAVFISYIWNYTHVYKVIKQSAITSARAKFSKDVIYRRWNAGHGGVYAPITEKNQPNPFLTHVKERDLETLSGRKLTLVNPAYMTRQVHELGRQKEKVQGHITSLNPIRPGNSPDAWERKALMKFEKGESEFYSVEMVDNNLYMRFMSPLKTEKGCLKCHAHQGYKEGDIRGGISVSIPMALYLAFAGEQVKVQVLMHILFFLFGLTGIILGIRVAGKRVAERDHAVEMLEKEEKRLAGVLEGTNAGTWDWNITTGEVILNERWAEIIGYTLDELKPIDGNTLNNKIHSHDLPVVKSLLKRHLNGEINYFNVEFRQSHKDGSWQWVNSHGKVIEWTVDGNPLRMSGTSLDITERKLVEEKLEKLFTDTKQMNMIMTDREMRVLEMKKEVNSLLVELGRDSKYLSVD